MHICAQSDSVQLRLGLFRPHIKELFFAGALSLSFVLCNHRALTSDIEIGQLRSSGGHRTVFHILYALFVNYSNSFLSLCLFFVDCALPKCESKLDGPGQTSGWSV